MNGDTSGGAMKAADDAMQEDKVMVDPEALRALALGAMVHPLTDSEVTQFDASDMLDAADHVAVMLPVAEGAPMQYRQTAGGDAVISMHFVVPKGLLDDSTSVVLLVNQPPDQPKFLKRLAGAALRLMVARDDVHVPVDTAG